MRRAILTPLWEQQEKYSEISLGRTHHLADTLYKGDKDFAPILQFSGQTLLKVICIKRAIL